MRHLLCSFLNALLPLEEGHTIVSLDLLPIQEAPKVPLLWRYTLTAARCIDNYGGQFVASVQMLWTSSFKPFIRRGGSETCISPLTRDGKYESAQPVYALCLVNDVVEPDAAAYYHHQCSVHTTEPERRLDGLEVVFVELPKFQAASQPEKRMRTLWLRYLTEIKDQTEHISADLLAVPEIEQAIACLREADFTRAELARYDTYWDAISSERTLIDATRREGIARGRLLSQQRMREENQAQGVAEGRQAAIYKIARRLLETGVSAAVVSETTSLSVDEVRQIAARKLPPTPGGDFS